MTQTSGAPVPARSLFAPSAHLRRRRRSETRLKLYGLAAMLLSAFALVALLGSVVVRATGALTESYVTLDVTVDPAVLDLGDNPSDTDIRRADNGALILTALQNRFPLATGRSARKELKDIISGGAPFELGDDIAADLGVIGQTSAFRLLASDTADLYLKGSYGTLETLTPAGRLTVTEGRRSSVTLSSTADDFLPALAVAKAGLVRTAENLREKASRQDNAVTVYTERAAAAADDDARQTQTDKADRAAAKRDKFLADAAALEARAAAPGGNEKLDDDSRSFLVTVAGGWVRLTEVGTNSATGELLTTATLPVTGATGWGLHATGLAESDRKISDRQIAWLESLDADGAVKRSFNLRFFTAADSRAPELAGIRGAVVGSFWTMLVTFLLVFPVGVLGAIYLEEFAPKNALTGFIEVNINNLAAVPSIIFGLLGLSVFLGFFGVPRSAPLAGGIVLALMTLPTIIIAARVSMAAVPPSIREAALGVGASRVQTAFHHVLPLALPGILTGTIIGMARALGETAPLITIGMVAFIVDVPSGITDSATVLPVQIFRWSDFPEQAFEARTAAAICTLLVFLIFMNIVAVILRRKFERRW